MQQGSTLFATRAGIALSGFLLTASAFGSAIGIYTRTAPPPAFATLVGTPARSALTAAVVELAFGDVTRAVSRAQFAGLPANLSVYVEAPSLPAARSATVIGWAEASIREWLPAIPSVRVSFVASPGVANVVVRFEDRLTVGGRRVAGVIDWQRTVRTRGSATELDLRALIRISNRYATGALMTEGQIKKTVAHEFGHLLGLDDEDCSKALMGPIGPSATGTVSEREKQAVADLILRSEEIVVGASSTRRQSREPRIFTFVK